MARVNNVRFRTGRLYTIIFHSGIMAFCEYLEYKEEKLHFRVLSHTARHDELLFSGKLITADKFSFNGAGNPKIRNMSKAELVLYGKKET